MVDRLYTLGGRSHKLWYALPKASNAEVEGCKSLQELSLRGIFYSLAPGDYLESNTIVNEIWLPPDPGPGPVAHQLFGESVHKPDHVVWYRCDFDEGKIIAVWAVSPKFNECSLKFGIKGADGSVTVIDAPDCKFGAKKPNK
mgnify:CR=1 FL=1